MVEGDDAGTATSSRSRVVRQETADIRATGSGGVGTSRQDELLPRHAPATIAAEPLLGHS